MTSRTPWIAAWLACLLLTPVTGQQAKPQAYPDGEFKKSIASTWEKLATWCVEKKLIEEGHAAAAEALALDPDNAKAKAAKGATGESSAAEPDQKEYAAKLAATKRNAALIYQKWGSIQDDYDHDALWMKALELDPKTIGPVFEAEWKKAIQKAQWKRVGPLVAKAEEILGTDPHRIAQLRDAEIKSSDATPFLKKASTHELRYWFSLPKGWTPAKKWKVLVCVDGAGCGFEGQCGRFMAKRADLPLIIIAPCTFANTNSLKKERYPFYPQSLLDEVDRTGRMGFDDPGLMIVLEDLKKHYNAEDKFFITGYSGGGNLTWWNIFTRPERLLGAFPANANFAAAPREAPANGGRDVIVRAFQGDKDSNFEALTQQWNRAAEIAKSWGYTNYTREILPGIGHTACHENVYKAIREILK